ncbi:MAG: ABC transporter substrate-binding protein [Alphaproteobacteria bacterium]
MTTNAGLTGVGLFRRHVIAGGLALSLALGGSAAIAETPKDMLVMAKNINDIINLDPAEVFEFTSIEMIANIYDRVMTFEPDNLTTLVGGVVESHEISEDGKTITLQLRPGQTFHSGNPVTTADVAFSLQRVIKLNKTPSFIFTQFGWNADNIDDAVQAIDDNVIQVKILSDLSASVALSALSSGVASVVDMKLAMSNEVDGDLGHKWLETNTAGSGPYILKSWKPNEIVTMEANPNFRGGEPTMKRVVMRHVPEAAAQRLLLEKGDVDIARNLTPDQAAGLAGNVDIAVDSDGKSLVYYTAINTTNDVLGNPKFQEAMRYLVDYQGMVGSFLKNQYKVHQSFWPSGFWASLDDTPFALDIERAKGLLQEIDIPADFTLNIDTLNESPFSEIAQSIQQTLGQAGIKSEIVLSEGKTLWPKYRARKHDLIVAYWGPDYLDPHSNADSFAHNPDNRLEAQLGGKLAWRNAWSDEGINALTEKAAATLDPEERKAMYIDLQHRLQDASPFVVMFQQNEQLARRANVKGFVNGPSSDLVFYRNTTK